MMDGEPPEATKAAIDEFQRVRGWTINAFAQMELTLGFMAASCWDLPEYADLRVQIPMTATNRVKALEQILDRRGPMSPYAERLRALLDGFVALGELRHFMAHGMCRFDMTPHGAHAARLWRYLPPEKGGAPELVELYIDLGGFAIAGERAVDMSADFMQLSREIFGSLPFSLSGPAVGGMRLLSDGSISGAAKMQSSAMGKIPPDSRHDDGA